jgi:hypothetical protein
MRKFFPAMVILLVILSACAPQTLPAATPTPSTTSTPISPTQTPTPTATPTLTNTLTVTPTATPEPQFSFVVTSDMSHTNSPEYVDYPNFFKGLLDHVALFGPGDFMVSVGDVIRAADTRWTIDAALGEDYLWYPIIGNHDFGAEDLSFLQNYDYDQNGPDEPNITRWGPDPCPRTTYSFDIQNTHLVALNVYCDESGPGGIDGSISDPIYDWLAADLAETDQPHIFVFGHEPAFPQPDAQTGDLRHAYESLDQYPEARDRFWNLLVEHEVVAYINGHTHGFSAVQINGVWQLDAGHSMGTRAAPSPGTFLIITVEGESIQLKVYRGEDGPGFSYILRQETLLRP